VGGISFSNLRRSYQLPAWFLGILVDSDNIDKIRALKKKEHFQTRVVSSVRGLRDIEDPFDLSQIQQEITRYEPLIVKPIWRALGVQLEHGGTNDGSLTSKPICKPLKAGKSTKQTERTAFISSCQSILDEWLRSDLEIVGTGIKEIRIHEPYDNNPQPNSLDSVINLSTPAPATKIMYESKGSFSELVELARLIVWHRFLLLRRENLSFLRRYIRENRHEVYKHLVQVRWPSTNLQVYANASAGDPEVVVKTGEGLVATRLSRGTRISMYPIAKCCVGVLSDGLDSPYECGRKGDRLPYGELLPLDGGEERCRGCTSDADRLKFGIKSALRVATDREAVLGKFTDDLHYVYLSLFGRRLKVGRARLSRGIARLIEQGAADALVIFPLTSYSQADAFEVEILAHLKSRIDELSKLEIDAVSDRAYTQDKLTLIVSRYNRSFETRGHIYEELLNVLRCSESLGIKLSILQHRIISLLSNWTLPEDPEAFSKGQFKGYLTQINGKVMGVIGSLLVVDRALVDLERLQGCIFRGGGFD
jgi:hypothetical protein